MTGERCLTCVLRDDWLDKGKCYADLEFHADDDRCDFWVGSLRDEPVNGPEALVAKDVITYPLSAFTEGEEDD